MNKGQKANFIALVHVVWILWGLVSLPLTLLVSGYAVVALIFMVITLLSWVVWRGCLFLQWENDLRNKHVPGTSYEGAFIAHYVNKYFGTNLTTVGVRVTIYTFMIVLLAAALAKTF